jgi:imidazolonepropionase-like amidohydrolase
VSPQDTADVRATLTRLRGEGFVAIKVIQDDGLLWTSRDAVVPRLPHDVFRVLATHARSLGMRVYVHVSQLVDAEAAVAAGANVFVHGIMDSLLPDRLWSRMREERVVWAPAFRIVAAGADRAGYAKRILGDAALERKLSTAERDAMSADVAGMTPSGAEPFAGLLPNGSRYIRVLHGNTRQARAHGLVIAVGSDSGASGNGPGIGTHIEMELLQDAGLTPAEVVVAATFGGARAMGLENDIGTVEPGKLADLLILQRDPTIDIRNARTIEWIIKEGRATRVDRLP